MPDPLLIATDGSRSASSAFRFGAAYAASVGAAIEVITVVEPLSDLPMPLPHRDELEQAHARGVAERVRDQLREEVGLVEWPVHVRVDRPAPAIDRAARQIGARLVILAVDGRRPHADDTVIELLHLVDRPLFVARDGAVPQAALVGIDFQPGSIRAAEEALRLVGPAGTIHLAHIRPCLDFPAALVWDWSDRYELAVEAGLGALSARLTELGAGAVVAHRRSGDPVTELAALHGDLSADVLAFGAAGYVCHGRAVLGRVARRLIQEGVRPLLATPVLPHVADAAAQPVTTMAASPQAA